MPAYFSLLAKALLLVLLSAGSALALAVSDGVLDTSYGSAGVAKLSLPGWRLAPQAAVLAADGSLYVAGQARGQEEPVWQAFLTKFTSAGVVDTGFGTGGHVLLPVGEDFTATQLLQTVDGQLRLVGYTGRKAVIFAINSTGQVVAGYGRAGCWVGTADPDGGSAVARMKVAGAGLLAGGEVMLLLQQGDYVSVRSVSAAGLGNEASSQDLLFGSADCAALDVTGRWFLVAGVFLDQSGLSQQVLRYPASPAEGSLTAALVSPSPLSAQRGGHSLLGAADGTTTLLALPATGTPGLTLSRFRAGALDSLFSADGVQTYNIGSVGDSPAGMVLRAADGRIFVAATRMDASSASSFCLLWLRGDGSLDASFGALGTTTYSPAGVQTKAAGLVMRADGSKVLVFGSGQPTAGNALPSVYVARFNTGSARSTAVPPVVTTAPQATAVPLGSAATLSVVATGSDTLGYQWYKDGVELYGEEASSLHRAPLSLADQGLYHVVVSNVWGRVTTEPIYLNAVWLPQLTGPVQPLNPTPLGTTVSLAVQVTGGDPLTGFSYQWQRNGADVEGAREATLTLPGEAALGGSYQCVVRNADGSSSSAAVAVNLMPEKTARLTVGNALLPVGSPFQPAAIVSLRPTVSQPFYDEGVYQTWVKDGVFLPRAPDIASTVLSDAGSYHCRVGTFGGVLITPIVQLGLVHTQPSQLVVAAGQTARLTAPAAGKGLSFVWQKGGSPLSNTGRIVGVNTQTLVINQSSDADDGSYQCVVSAYGQTLAAGAIQLAVESLPPVITTSTLPAGQVGRPYSAVLNGLYSPTQFSITGLPSGLSYQTRTGLISGLPEAAGSYPLSVVATNPVGSSAPAAFTLVIQPLPAGVAGTFSGLVGDAAAPVGTARVVVTAAGSFTANLTVGNDDGSTHALVCSGVLREDPAVMANYAARSTSMVLPAFLRTGTGTVIGPGGDVGTLELLWTPAAGMSAQLMSGTGTARPVSLYSNPWHTALRPALAYRGYYTTALSWARASEGEGYATFTVQNDGSYTLVGRLPEGTAVSFAGFMDGSGASWLHSWLYGLKGHLAGTLQLQGGTAPLYTDTDVRGALRWSSPTLGLSQEPMQAMGARYLRASAPDTSGLLMSAPLAPDNVRLVLENGVLGYQLPSGTPTATPTFFNQDLTLLPSHLVSLPGYVAGDTMEYRNLILNEATGLFTGVALRQYPLARATISFQGVMTRADATRVQGYGTGYFLNSFRPASSSTTLTTTGRVRLLPRVQQQPD